MIASISSAVSARPTIAWVVSRFPSLQPRLGGAGGSTTAPPRGAEERVRVASGVVEGFSGQQPADHRHDEVFRGWIEDRFLVELGGRVMAPVLQPILPGAHVNALRSAIQQLDGINPKARAVLNDAVASHAALQHGRCALQGV